jgi:hypothetical protein
VTTTVLAEGNSNCPTGGVAVHSASGTSYVCNGAAATRALAASPVNAAQIAQINAWAGLPAGTSWSLCYKGTRDNRPEGFIVSSATAGFHARCDGRAGSFFVAKTGTGQIFGGYTALAWGNSTSCVYRADPAAFLFSLTNNFKHARTGSYVDYGIYDCPTSGPTFGAGHDFTTNLSSSIYVNLGYTYACRVGTVGSATCRNDFAGAYQPDIVELEVYTRN